MWTKQRDKSLSMPSIFCRSGTSLIILNPSYSRTLRVAFTASGKYMGSPPFSVLKTYNSTAFSANLSVSFFGVERCSSRKSSYPSTVDSSTLCTWRRAM